VPGGGTDTFERFTERARQVVVLAQDEARLLRHDYIGTEHLLLGLLREEEGLAARVLDELGVTLEGVRTRVAHIVGLGEDAPATGQIPFTPRAKKVLELGLREAVSFKHNYIGTEHILLGVARVEEGVGAKILLELGAGPEVVRTRVLGMLGGRGGDYDHAVDTFTSAEQLAEAAEGWLREGWEISSITVQRRRRRTA
jgi:ATP-dependent Clp protease ATP-binding subunit ClpC